MRLAPQEAAAQQQSKRPLAGWSRLGYQLHYADLFRNYHSVCQRDKFRASDSIGNKVNGGIGLRIRTDEQPAGKEKEEYREGKREDIKLCCEKPA